MVKDGAKILNHHLLFWKFGVSTPCIIFCRVHYLYSALTKKNLPMHHGFPTGCW